MSKHPYDPARRYDAPLDAPLEDAPRRPVRVLAARLTFWICTDRICQAIVHWAPPRVMGCVLVHGQGDCPFCRSKVERKKTFWLQVSAKEGADAPTDLLELTPGALASEPHLLGADGHLWGRRLTVWRYPGAPADPMYAELDTSISPKDLPRVKDTLSILIRIWQARTRQETLERYSRGRDGKSLGGEGEERGGDRGA